MKYLVQLKGSKPLLENVSACYQGDFAEIKKIGDEWFLESSAFNSCANGGEVFPIARRLLRLIHRVTAIYGMLFSPFEIGYVECFSDSGVPVNRALQVTQRIQLYSLEGLKELQESRAGQSFGTALVGSTRADKALEEALSLVGDGEELQWSQMYDIIEFVGGANVIARKGWSNRDQIRRCRQTANHYRHLGSPVDYPLPPDPPSPGEARILVLGVLKKWILAQLGSR